MPHDICELQPPDLWLPPQGSCELAPAGPEANPHSWQADGSAQPGFASELMSHWTEADDGGSCELAPGAVDWKGQWQTEAYRQLGVTQEEALHMDPRARNTLITAAYAQMFMSDPRLFKWAGMAAYASDMVGQGMDRADDVTRSAGNLGPFFLAAGTPTGAELKEALADGNKAVFDDLYWQHVAFQRGGLPALEQAFQAGQLSEEQMEAWKKLSAAKQALQQENGASGEDDGARSQVWEASKGLLYYEQSETLQKGVYDKHRDAFGWLSGNMNPSGLDSPIPGDAHSFGSSVPGGDIGNLTDRWGWIEHSMLPSWQERDAGSPDAVRTDQTTFEQHGEDLKKQVSAVRARHALGQVE